MNVKGVWTLEIYTKQYWTYLFSVMYMYVSMYVCMWVSAGMNAFMYVGMDCAYICSTVQNYSGPN